MSHVGGLDNVSRLAAATHFDNQARTHQDYLYPYPYPYPSTSTSTTRRARSSTKLSPLYLPISPLYLPYISPT